MADELPNRLMAHPEWGVCDADRRVALIAEFQHGVATREQLLGVGLTRHSVDTRLRQGRLHFIHRGVYAVGHESLLPLGLEAAALLASGERAVLSGRSSAAVWGLCPTPANEVFVTVQGDGGRKRAGITVSRLQLEAHEIRVRHGLAVTSPARTILDLAATPDLERIVGEALGTKLVTERELRTAVDEASGRRGIQKLRALLDGPGGPAFTRSEAERRFLALVRKGGLPPPQANAWIAGLEVDFLWPDHRLVAEVDGNFHAYGPRREHDHRRDARLEAAGYDVIRTTWHQIIDEPETLLVRLTRRLAVRA
jgi:very-short-patch-repair endonuclease